MMEMLTGEIMRTKQVEWIRMSIRQAKQRLFDDLGKTIDEGKRYTVLLIGQRQNLREKVARLSTLLQLPENDRCSLDVLQEAGYWNGDEDEFWNYLPPGIKARRRAYR